MRHYGYFPSWSPAQIQSMPAPYTDYPRAWISVSLHQSKGLVRGSIASFSHLEGDPRITLKVHTSQFQEPPQAAGPGNGDPLPNRAQWSDLSGPPEMLWEECQTHKNKTQTQVVGEKEDLLH
jgi:hypothetical protein